MNQPRYPDDRTGFDSDTITAARGEQALTDALSLLQNFRQANPDYTGPIRLHIDLKLGPDTEQTTD
ncbi:hypothetical protein [Streptomyces sp. NPDC018584]|uniref:hypothetical protein n=1 Tax=unclassified Streptomyces TaxID=2593676 RepID=UPI00379909DA